jgi:molecular chaperone DnaK
MVQQRVKEFFGREPHRGVNPDEVVALGAAVQAGVLAGDVTDILLLDVTPLSLGIETLGGVMTTLIPRNTTIPTKKSEVFSTAADSQPSVEVHVLQGERPMARDNRTLGRFHLDGIPPAPRGVPQIEVTFDLDANGIVNVSAVDRATNKRQAITITASSGLHENEIKKMVNEASEHEAEDRSRREEIEARNKLDSMIYSTEKLMNENRAKISTEDASALEAAIARGRKALEKGDKDEILGATDQLTKASHKMAEAMYRAAGAYSGGQAGPGPSEPGGPAGGGGGGGGGDGKGGREGVIDAEFEESK